MNEPLRQSDHSGSDIETLLRVLGEQRRAVGGFFSAVVGTALVGTLLLAPQYQAVALILLMPQAGQEMDGTEVVANEPGYLESRDRARTQIQIISSRAVLDEVVRRYDALDYADFDRADDPVEVLRAAISAAPREDTQLVEIVVTDGDPERAAVLANLVAEVYAASRLAVRTGAAKEARAWLDARARSSRQALDEASAAVIAFKETNDVVDIDEKVDGISARLSALQAALGTATTERVLLRSRLDEHGRLLARQDYGVLAGLFADPALETMVKEQATLVTRNAGVLSNYGDQHPEYLRAVEHARRVEALIATEVQRNVGGERSRVDTLVRQEHELGGALVVVKAELLEKERLRARYAELKLEEERARRLHGAIAERGAEVELQAASNLSDVRIVDRALRPTEPSSPSLLINLSVAVALGLAGGVALALLRHRLDDTIRSAADVEQSLELPLLGALPSLPGDTAPGARALYNFDHPRSLSAEGFRGLRAMVEGTSPPGGRRRLLVTSCLPGEGKTYAALGLAAAYAQLGRDVLLIDADLRVPSLHALLDTPIAPGLTDALANIEGAGRLVRATRVPGLHVLPRGTRAGYPNEIIASAEFERLLEHLGQTWPVIVLDTPPASLVSDAQALAPRVDGVILVVRRGRVRRAVLQHTLRQFGRVGARVLGVALNDLPAGEHRAGPYYDELAVAERAAEG